MPRLRPGIGKKDEHAIEGCIGELRNKIARVPAPQPHVRQASLLDRRQQLRHAVNERFCADDADARVSLGLPREVLPASEPDFEPGFALAWKERERINPALALGNADL